MCTFAVEGILNSHYGLLGKPDKESNFSSDTEVRCVCERGMSERGWKGKEGKRERKRHYVYVFFPCACNPVKSIVTKIRVCCYIIVKNHHFVYLLQTNRKKICNLLF